MKLNCDQHMLPHVTGVNMLEFMALRRGDILFVDSSHRLNNPDVQLLWTEVMPRLAPGVLVHVHDIFVGESFCKARPEVYPSDWSESKMVRQWLSSNLGFKVLLSGSYLDCHRPQAVAEALGRRCPADVAATSLWVERTGVFAVAEAAAAGGAGVDCDAAAGKWGARCENSVEAVPLWEARHKHMLETPGIDMREAAQQGWMRECAAYKSEYQRYGAGPRARGGWGPGWPCSVRVWGSGGSGSVAAWRACPLEPRTQDAPGGSRRVAAGEWRRSGTDACPPPPPLPARPQAGHTARTARTTCSRSATQLS